MDRRTFIKGAALGLGATAVGGPAQASDLVNLVLPSLGIETKPARTPVKHLVVVMMENRSVDHYLGWYGQENPDFDGRQQMHFVDQREGPDGPLVATRDWGARGLRNHHGRGFKDPSHGWTGGRLERNGGACDGWLDPGTGNDEYALAYYGAEDVPVWAQLTRGWQAYDRWHCSLLGPTQPNRLYSYSGDSGGTKSNDLPPELAGEHPEWALGWDWQTVWGLCQNHGVSTAYYYSNLPETAFWGTRHLHQSRHVSEFFLACATGTLPQVSYVDPWFIAPGGISNDDHPHADLRLGQLFLSDLVEAFTSSPHYGSGAMVITYDEWGGFWDHVDPPRIGDERATPEDPGGADDFGQTGFRVPSTIVSPWTRHGGVDHTTYDHTSALRFIAENWGLPYLSERVRSTNSLEPAFRQFRHHDLDVDFTRYRLPLQERLALLVDPSLHDLAAGEVPDIVPGQLTNPVVGPLEDALGQELPLGGGPLTDAVSDLHRLAETGWFDGLGFAVDHRFEDGFLRPSDVRAALRP
jgi:phospholipase C